MYCRIIGKLTMYADDVFLELESPVSEADDDAFERFEGVRAILLSFRATS